MDAATIMTAGEVADFIGKSVDWVRRKDGLLWPAKTATGLRIYSRWLVEQVAKELNR